VATTPLAIRTTALLGGSFDPPHVCHLLISLYVLQATEAREVWWVPCAQHAFGKDSAPFEQRLALCRTAARHVPALSVLGLERTRGGISYTIDTVTELRAAHPDRNFLWIIGSDLLDELPRWHRWDELREQVTFLVVPRGDTPLPPEPAGARLRWLPVAFPDVSSTAVREALADGGDVRGWLDGEVLAALRREGLYRSS
jgi:nicotinate-nucleotide adenylyltransferase